MLEDALDVARRLDLWGPARQQLEDETWDEWHDAEPKEPPEPWWDEGDPEGPAQDEAWRAEHDLWEKAHGEWEQAEPGWGAPGGITDGRILARILDKLIKAGASQVEYVKSDDLAYLLAVTAEAGESVTSPATERVCLCGCGRPVTSPRPEAKYATGACRVSAHRAR